MIDYLRLHPVEQLYCGLPVEKSQYLVSLINYCDNHFIQFFLVPNLHTYLKRQVHMEMVGMIVDRKGCEVVYNSGNHSILKPMK